MKTKLTKLLILVVLFAINYSGTAQKTTSPVLLKIADEEITKEEFLSVFNKNNIKNEKADEKSIREYLQLYVNFKLKVKEAKEVGLDTLTSFKTELAGYRKQLAQPYLTDNEINEKLLKEAYDRMQYDVKANHILIRTASTDPKDTLEAYNKILNIRKRIIKGEKFEDLAYEHSADSRRGKVEDIEEAKKSAGNLGYFTVFDMIYPFETGAYNTKIGEISLPIRTQFGYHLIKVADKKEAMGKVQVAHILVSLAKDASEEENINAQKKSEEIYQKIIAGESFEDLARTFSDDKGSGPRGGVLPWFGVNRNIEEFVVSISELDEIGSISKPVRTYLGWHIIKLVNKKEIGEYDKEKADIKAKIAKDERTLKSRKSIIKKIKNENKFVEYPKAKVAFYEYIDESIYEGKWDAASADGKKDIIFSIEEDIYTQEDFTNYILKHQRAGKKENIKSFVNRIYDFFLDEKCLDFENIRLEQKYPEFKTLIEEYSNGILLFDLTDKKVWSKAIKDSTGLANFYAKNKEKYMWKERVEATIYTCANEKIAKSTRKLIKEAMKKEYTTDNIVNIINNESKLNLKVESAVFSKGENKTIDSANWVIGITDNVTTDNYIEFIKIEKVLPPQPKSLDEARGIITSDYQNYLETKWITELRNKYKVDVNETTLSTIWK